MTVEVTSTMETVCSVPREQKLLELVTLAVKTKLLSATLPKFTVLGVAGVWLLTVVFWVQAFLAIQRQYHPTPSVDSVEEHVEYNDQRISDLKGDVVSRLDNMESEMDKRRDRSDARYKSMSDSLDSLKHDMAFIWGGGIIGTALITLLLTLNVIKTNNTEKKLTEMPAPPNILQEDFEQIATMFEYMRSAKEKERRRDQGWNR